MKMTTATRVAALAVGLSLVGATAIAAPNDGRSRGNQNDTAAEQQKPDAKGNRTAKPRGNAAPAEQAAPARRQATPPNRDRQTRAVRPAPNQRAVTDNRRGRNQVQTDRRNNTPAVRNTRAGRDGVRNNDRRRDVRNNDRRNDVRNNDRRRADVQQYRRNMVAPKRYRVAQYRWRDGFSYQRYGYGQRLPSVYYGRNHWLANFLAYGLFAPPPGYVWVRYGPDALLIDEYTGEIVQVRYNMFYS